jgi:hypothetical protein
MADLDAERCGVDADGHRAGLLGKQISERFDPLAFQISVTR